jgi:single-strand DNA-binding protein
MANLNKVFLIGNLTRDPELRYTPSGTPVTEFGLAINNSRTGKDGKRYEDTVFVDITLWARQAEVASEYLSKGRPVLIEGRLQLDQWEGKDGRKMSKLRVIGERMQMLGSRGDSAGRQPHAPSAVPAGDEPSDFADGPDIASGPEGGDDIPF